MSNATNGIEQVTQYPMTEWPDGWETVDRTIAAKLETELQRELHLSHPLFGQKVSVIARRIDRDDVLLCVHCNKQYFAQVHLTWHIENDDEFPWTIPYEDLEDWLAEYKS